MDAAPPTTADAFKVAIEAGDLVIEFGSTQPAGPGGLGRVLVSDRVILPRQAAERLAHALGGALLRHAPALQASEQAAQRGDVPVNAPPDDAADPAAALLRMVGELSVPHHYERSFRMSGRGLQANRFLLTLDRRDIGGDAAGRVFAIAERLRMPAALRAWAEAPFAAAACVHFGFEGDGDSPVCKLYLERAVPAEEAQAARRRGEPVRLHLAFKWALDGSTQVTTEYFWHPGLSAAQIEERLAQHVYRGGAQRSLEIAKAMLALGAERAPAEELQYLEVHEEGNGRRSFDLNLYNARLQMKDAQPLLQRMRDAHGVRPGQFQALYDQIKDKALGHLAGGVHRDGADFFNLYYGVAGFPQFHARFG